MVREDGVTKLLDFGIASAANRTTRTATGVLKGKVAYMAPEQLLSEHVGPRTDQYALGVVLWELLCNRPLFRAEREAELMKKVLDAQIPRPSSIVPIDAALDAVVMRMLERTSTRRFASCADVSKALDALIATTTGVVESPGEFMRRLGTSDLVVGPRVDADDFIIDLKSPLPPKPSDDVTTPLARSHMPTTTRAPPSLVAAPIPSATHAPAPEFWSSANYVNGLGRALKKLGQFETVVAVSSAPVAAMLRDPTSQSWWGTQISIDLHLDIAKVGGVALLKRVGHLAVFESISVMVRPFVTVMLALGGPSPATLFSRFGQVTQTSVKNVRFDWKPSGPNAGTLVIEYPSPVPPEILAAWAGALEYAFELTKARPGPTQATHEGGGKLRFDLSWN